MNKTDPQYSPAQLQKEICIRIKPLNERTLAMTNMSNEQIREAASERAPFGMIELVQQYITDNIFNTLNTLEQARVLTARESFEAAQKLYEAAINEGYLYAHNNLGQIALLTKDHRKAIWHFNSNPDGISTMICKANLLFEQGHITQVQEIATTLNPSLNKITYAMQLFFGGQLAHLLGKMHIEKHELEAAEHYLRQSVSRGNRHAAVALGRLVIHPSNNKYEPNAAIQYLLHAVRLGLPEAYIQIAALYLAHGDDDSANKILTTAAKYGLYMTDDERTQIIMQRTHAITAPQ